MTAAQVIDEIARRGAREMLQSALEAEVDDFLRRNDHVRDEDGLRLVVRNGHTKPRTVLTGAGALTLSAPRARYNGDDEEQRAKFKFTSAILPPYLRRSRSIEDLIPWLYLRGISTGDFTEALQALLGPGAKGLSPNVIVQLKDHWRVEYDAWNRRDLSKAEYVYVWADGVYFNIRLDSDDRQCILVVLGATKEGRKELLAVQDGYRENEESWHELLADLKARGLKPPKLAIGDGALGFWKALRKDFPKTREQRCWVHKTANVLNKMPKAVQPRAKSDLHQIYLAETRDAAKKAWDTFVAKYSDKYDAAVACLKKDRDELLAFYDFPAKHEPMAYGRAATRPLGQGREREARRARSVHALARPRAATRIRFLRGPPHAERRGRS